MTIGRLTAGIEMTFGQRWEFQLEDGVKTEITPPDDVRGFASVQIHFENTVANPEEGFIE